MTISSTTNPKVQYNGDDSTTAFSTSFVFVAEGDLEVYLDDTLQTITTDYTVSGGGTPAATGTVTMGTAPATGEVLTIVRNTARTQGTDYVENDAFPAETHEAALDRLTLISQEIDNKFARTVLQSVSTTVENLTLPAPEASKYLRWNSGATALENAAATSGIADIVEDTTPQLGGNLDLNGNSITFPSVTVSDVLDEDTMSSDSATKLATQQSIKAYVDSQVSGAGGGAWEYISTTTISGGATSTVDLTSLDFSTYAEYVILLEDLGIDGTATAGDINVRLSDSSSFVTTSTYYYSHDGIRMGTTTGYSLAGTAQSSINLMTFVATSQYRVLNGECRIRAGNSLAPAGIEGVRPTFNFVGTENTDLISGYTGAVFQSAGLSSDVTACDGVRFYTTAGVFIDGGKLHLYGIKRS